MPNQEDYIIEAECRCSFELESFKSGPEIDRETRAVIETAFRRGYSQGYNAGVSDSRDETETAVDEQQQRIYDWACKTHDGVFQIPPYLGAYDWDPCPLPE